MTEEKWINNGTPVPTIGIATTTHGGALNEVQRVGFTASGTGFAGGTFTLTFGGQTTSGIGYNASAATVQSALEALSNIGVGDVTVTKLQDTTTAQEWRITFTGALAAANQSQVTINSSGVTVMGIKTDIQATDTNGQPATTDEVQTITLSNATGGTFRLAFGGQTTAPLAYNASAATVESSLEALTSVDNVTVTGSAGGPWTVTFAGTHADTNVATIQGDAATAESGSVGRTLTYEYDLATQLTEAGDSDSGYDFTYDNLGRILTVSNVDTPNLPDVVLTNAYDSRSNRTSVSAVVNSTNDFKTDYTYDDLSRMTRVEQNGNGGNTVASKRANFEYNGLGQFTKISREYKPSGTWTEVATSHYTYDDDSRLTGLAYKRNSTDMFTAYAWTYDNMGRVTQMSGQDGTSDYTYDKTSQVTAVDHSFQTDESYAFDSNGNRDDASYTVGTNNQMSSDGTYDYTYDDEGNLILRTEISTGYYREFVWDHRNRLTQVLDKDDVDTVLKQFDYKYDAFDRRIQKSIDNDGPGAGAAVVTRHVYDGDNIVLEYNGSNTLTHRYVYGPDVDQILADEDATNAILFPLADNLGTVRDLINSSGTVQNHIKYEGFGKVTSESNSAINHLFAFTGRERDEETGLQYHRGRYYGPATGKWTSDDPSGFSGGDANLSRYVSNSPLDYVDPDGHEETKKPSKPKGDSSGQPFKPGKEKLPKQLDPKDNVKDIVGIYDKQHVPADPVHHAGPTHLYEGADYWADSVLAAGSVAELEKKMKEYVDKYGLIDKLYICDHGWLGGTQSFGNEMMSAEKLIELHKKYMAKNGMIVLTGCLVSNEQYCQAIANGTGGKVWASKDYVHWPKLSSDGWELYVPRTEDVYDWFPHGG